MGLLDRDAILAADDTETREVDVPEWGGSVKVRGLTAKESELWQKDALIGPMPLDEPKKRKGQPAQVREARMANMETTLVALGTIDANGKRLFSLDDVKALGEKSSKSLGRVSKAIRELSGISEEDVEELAEGLDPSPSEPSKDAFASPSGAPSTSSSSVPAPSGR